MVDGPLHVRAVAKLAILGGGIGAQTLQANTNTTRHSGGPSPVAPCRSSVDQMVKYVFPLILQKHRIQKHTQPQWEHSQGKPKRQ